MPAWLPADVASGEPPADPMSWGKGAGKLSEEMVASWQHIAFPFQFSLFSEHAIAKAKLMTSNGRRIPHRHDSDSFTKSCSAEEVLLEPEPTQYDLQSNMFHNVSKLVLCDRRGKVAAQGLPCKRSL